MALPGKNETVAQLVRNFVDRFGGRRYLDQYELWRWIEEVLVPAWEFAANHQNDSDTPEVVVRLPKRRRRKAQKKKR